MLFSNKNQTSYEYYGKLLTKIKVISKTRCILHYLNNFNMLFKYLYKQSKIFKTIYSIRNTVFLSFIYWCYYGCFSHSVCIQVYLLYHFKSNLWLSVLFISTEKCVVCETESTSICFVPSFSRTLGGLHPLSFR